MAPAPARRLVAKDWTSEGGRMYFVYYDYKPLSDSDPEVARGVHEFQMSQIFWEHYKEPFFGWVAVGVHIPFEYVDRGVLSRAWDKVRESNQEDAVVLWRYLQDAPKIHGIDPKVLKGLKAPRAPTPKPKPKPKPKQEATSYTPPPGEADPRVVSDVFGRLKRERMDAAGMDTPLPADPAPKARENQLSFL